MRILLVYPEYPDTFWSFKNSMRFVSKKALLPPLGLLTIASLLPEDFEKKLIDMNVAELKDSDILWADYVFISAMIIQKKSVGEVVNRCKALDKKVVAGGPLFSSLYEEYPNIDHFILDEGEVTLPLFLNDIKIGKLKKIYTSDIKPDITLSPVPKWDLVDLKHYVKMPIQFSRGCPFNCEFCDVVKLNGRIPRVKTPLQVIKELNALVRLGWNASIFIVDDNFIGNKVESKKLLRSLVRWRRLTRRKITFMTEVSLNLADDDELLELMKEAGFDAVFVGLETPSLESLKECGKAQNINRDPVSSVKKIQQYGMEVSAGFIVGFDSDDPTIFDRQIEFIQKTGVVVAMIGLLQALPGTKLYERLKSENRLIDDPTGNNTDFSTNFKTILDNDVLMKGYNNITSTVYSPKQYYDRILTFLESYNAHHIGGSFKLINFIALFKSMMVFGVTSKGRRYFWKVFFLSLFKFPKAFPKAITLIIYFAHFSKIFNEPEMQ